VNSLLPPSGFGLRASGFGLAASFALPVGEIFDTFETVSIDPGLTLGGE
jgi:hypothetical protein